MFDDDHIEPRERKVRPVIGWPGGKTRMLKHLLPLVPEHSLYVKGRWLLTFQDHDICRDLFAGYTIRSIARAKGIENRAGHSKKKTYRELIITSDRVDADVRKGAREA